jgi:hypothetical protein
MTWKLDPPHGKDIGTLMRAATEGMPRLEQELKRARFLTVMKQAAIGGLRADAGADRGDDIGPVRREPPHMFELRWQFGRHHYRLYFAEPPANPNHLVALEFHYKDIEGLSDEEIKAAQDEAISRAQVRYLAGESQNWGI